MRTSILFLAAVFGITVSICQPVSALNLKTEVWNGHTVLRASGEIVSGDAKKLEAILPTLKASPHGLPILLLDSVGGSVLEALRISQLLDRTPVHTVIPDGAKCASACASIVFVAGRNRTVAERGLLGQHSCAVGDVPSKVCNEIISQHAIAKGVSHGSIASFINHTAPKDMLWFDRQQADCYGITRYPFELEANFQKSEPCVIQVITGRIPPAQSVWRIDFNEDGYRAFLRPAADHMRELELNIFCRQAERGTLFLTIDIEGPYKVIRDSIVSATLDAAPISNRNANFSVSQTDEFFTRVTLKIPQADVRTILTKTNKLRVRLDVKKPYHPIEANTYLASSRKALLFSANNCAS